MHENGNCCKKGSHLKNTIDFQPISKYCKWDVHHTPYPFDTVSHILQKCYKTALNAYNGCHQVPPHKNRIKLNIWISSFERCMYLRIPQDHMISGDAYTRCYDDIPNVPSKSSYPWLTFMWFWYWNNILSCIWVFIPMQGKLNNNKPPPKKLRLHKGK